MPAAPREQPAGPAPAEGPDPAGPSREGLTAARLVASGVLAMAMLLPVTLPVAGLRDLVASRFEVSELLTSLFMSINMVGALFAAPLAGMLGDRTGRRKEWIVAALLVDAGLFLSLSFDLPFGVFLGLRLLEGCAHILALSLLLSLGADSAPEGKRGRVMGILGSGLTFGVALGAPLGGKLADVDVLLPLQVGAGLLVAAAGLALVALREPARRTRPPGLAQLSRAIRGRPALLVPLAYAFVDRFTVGFFTTTFALYLRRVLEFEPGRIGLLLALFLLPFSLLSYPLGRLSDRISRSLMVAGGSLVYGLLAASLGWWSGDALPWLMVALGLASAVMFVPNMVMTTDLAPDGARATALGAFNAAGSLGFVVGPLVGGGVSQLVAGWSGDWHAGYRAAFAVAGASELLVVLATLPVLRRLVRDARTT